MSQLYRIIPFLEILEVQHSLITHSLIALLSCNFFLDRRELFSILIPVLYCSSFVLFLRPASQLAPVATPLSSSKRALLNINSIAFSKQDIQSLYTKLPATLSNQSIRRIFHFACTATHTATQDVYRRIHTMASVRDVR